MCSRIYTRSDDEADVSIPTLGEKPESERVHSAGLTSVMKRLNRVAPEPEVPESPTTHTPQDANAPTNGKEGW